MNYDEIKQIACSIQLPAQSFSVLTNQQRSAEFRSRLSRESKRVVKEYNDPDLQDKARDIIPIERIHDEANSTTGDFQEALIKALLKWFKNEYFSWVDKLPCDSCGSNETVGAGAGQPTPFEIKHGAGR
jgi:peptide-N4-(N-acetyl-beta-glucosaminyl)asparagine amidase